ncbi:hypothetical protein B0A49_04939 [Cryomyces minteri]|uniref:Uncharacterized protein n=1 Tax=Cryomyces minteri TaxID=331657 RepID=A0A4U0X884_9PEZI|nr:hypothetical protein B0A49_04939 [Cryomyces minteri]
MPPRNTSGKNLTKLSRLTPAHAKESDEGAGLKHHQRSHSGSSTPATSPRQGSGMKRNSSTLAISRNTSHTALKKNHSSGQLTRLGSAKHIAKQHAKHDAPPIKRGLSQGNKPRQKSPSPPVAHLGVRFDLGDDDEQDEGWTEDSASQSPMTTRDNTRQNTRQNSVILEPLRPASEHPETQPQREAEEREEAEEKDEEEDDEEDDDDDDDAEDDEDDDDDEEVEISDSSSVHLGHSRPSNPTSSTPPRSSRSATAPQRSLPSSYHSSRPPDPEAITTRLLQQPHNAPPKTSTISAAASIAHSQGSTLTEASGGRDLVSRFISSGDGDSKDGTPRDGGYLPPKTKFGKENAELDARKRNKSAPNMAYANSLSHSRRSSAQSNGTSGTVTGTTTPSYQFRTQQKLELQRQSSTIQPSQHIPAVLPRTPYHLTGATVVYPAAGENGKIDPRLQKQFDAADLEYKVVRRYRNPVAEGIARLAEIPGVARPPKAPKHARGPSKSAAGEDGRPPVANAAREAATGDGHADPREALAVRKSRVSFAIATRGDGDGGAGGAGSDGGKGRETPEQICRRLWERVEIDGDG